MNTSNLKKYAPQARRDFRDAVTRRLNALGINADNKGNITTIEPQMSGSIMQIGSNNFDVKINGARNRLINHCQKSGFDSFVEHAAYTWFNRLCAIRYMELHDYLEHGFRVLSHPSNATGFEILDHAQDVAETLGLDRAQLIELKLAGDKDEELYRELLLGQCHALHVAMPFLFEALDDEAELLLPDNLTRTDSLIRGLIDEVPEEDWEQVEVIGWLYQFYISEKKDQVIGKVVKSEDIPAATQLFTPNWIVKYLVQNSVGRHWLQTYPESSIKGQMEYYIEPAEQSPDVIEQLKAITPESIEPESIKVLDPACGSGHILIEAYNVLKAIYEERGYRARDIPKLILENNLFGLDIDDRAAQLAGFALMMMARSDDKRIFTRNVRLHVLSLQESNDIDLPSLWRALNLSGSWQQGNMPDLFADDQQDLSSFNADNRYQLLKRTLERFTQAKTLGSLIEIPTEEYLELSELFATLTEFEHTGDAMQKSASKYLLQYIHQSLLLSQKYEAIVANPPYMGNRAGMNDIIKDFAESKYKESKGDTFSLFITRCNNMVSEGSFVSMVTLDSWITLVTYEQFRKTLLTTCNIEGFIHNPYEGKKPTAMGINFGIIAFVLKKTKSIATQGKFIKLRYIDLDPTGKPLRVVNNIEAKVIKSRSFLSLPSSSIVYTMSENDINMLSNSPLLSQKGESREGMATANNDLFIRWWFELDIEKIGFNLHSNEDALLSSKKWFPYIKGGEYRKWTGNFGLVVDWENDGINIKNNINPITNKVRSHNYNGEYAFKSGMTWTSMSSKGPSARYVPDGFMFDAKGPMYFSSEHICFISIALMNSLVGEFFLASLSATKDFKIGQILSLPLSESMENDTKIKSICEELILRINTLDALNETSWMFNSLSESKPGNFNNYKSHEKFILNKIIHNINKIEIEEWEINKLTCQNYGLSSLLNIADYKTSFTLETFISQPVCNFVSYVIGCILGRYSLDREGLVYAHTGNKGFTDLIEDGAYNTFPADEDGIIPLTDQEWFKDDATNRFREFVKVVWGEEHLQENLDFVAESLCLNAIKPKKSEPAMETIRRYLSTQFYKDHLKTYKKRPIYWLFSSGKQKAFECLVYLHRYNEGTLSRMRTEYVTPLLGKYSSYIDQLKQQVENATSTAEANRLKKEQDALIKKQVELREFDDKLKHYADMRISLDLDDGVKVNYGKFGDLLSDVKAITGSDSGAD